MFTSYAIADATTSPLSYDVSAADMQTALNGIVPSASIVGKFISMLY